MARVQDTEVNVVDFGVASSKTERSRCGSGSNSRNTW
jgi:hypothetical protein